MRGKKTWREKLADSKDLPRVEPISEAMSRTWGEGTIVIPAPPEVDEVTLSLSSQQRGPRVRCRPV